MEASSTARAYGLDNTIPPELRARARGLAIVAGRIESLGLKCTSFYRSPMVNAVLKFEQTHPGETPEPSLLAPRFTAHARCVAVDVGSNTNRTPAPEIKARILAEPSIAHLLDRNGAGGGALIEFNSTGSIDANEHVHFEFFPAALEALDDGVRT